MKNPSPTLFEPRGIPVINFDRNCYHCLYSESGVCSKKVPPPLQIYAGIFCLKFKEDPKHPIPSSRVWSLENLPEKDIGSEVRAIYTNKEGPPEEYWRYLNENNKNWKIQTLLDSLEEAKKADNRLEARDIRKNLRKLGYSLRDRSHLKN